MLKVLYLANYAPAEVGSGALNHTPEGNQPKYHKEIFDILEEIGLLVVPSRNAQTLIDNWSEFDYVFSLLNRAKYRNSEILVSALCEYFGLPYLGAHPNVRAVAEDKQVAKLVAKQFGFNVPRSKVYQNLSDVNSSPGFAGPYIAKLRYGASSKHITENCIQDSWAEIKPEVRRLLDLNDDDVIVEEFIDGTNISMPVIGGLPPTVLPAYQLRSEKKGQLVTYDQKRHLDGGMTRSILEDQAVYDQLRTRTLALYSELQPLDYFRMDFRLTSQNVPVFLEFNVCCNIGSKSGFSFCGERLGFSHKEIVTKILRHSFERQKIAWQAF
ncbi:MAG TPA: hypothetical protein VGO50_09060 [Pyrinomonadaceae bacterium]|jgi:D-alanine-D-alanine ligase|nr:hypothetical protein [Pyrinomonadaceae bacterium]